MALLKRIKASSLMETLVATVLIVVIFMISSMVLNNIVTNNIRNNTERIEEQMNKLEYQLVHKAIQIPFTTDFENWEISILQNNSNSTDNLLTMKAINRKTNKSLTKTMIVED